MNCYLCNSSSHIKVDGIVRDIPNLDILRCQDCGLVFLESFDHINDAFYEASKMRDVSSSIESWRRETLTDDMRRFNHLRADLADRSVLDFGTGNGQFLKLAGLVTKKAAGIELDSEVQEFLRTEGIRCGKNLSELSDDETFDIMTVFHVLEHLKDPISFLKQIAGKLNDGGKIIVEVPNADDALLSIYGSKEFSRFTYWGCHLMLFNESTLRKVVEAAGLRCLQASQVQRYPLSNHLLWLASGKPGGHVKWNFLNDKTLNDSYEKILSKLGACDTIFMEIVK